MAGTQVGEGYVEIRPETKGFFSKLRGLAGPIAGTLGALAIGKTLFVDPINQARDFTNTLNVLAAQSGATKGQMAAVSQTAIKLGADTKLPGTSAQDAAHAMLELAKGGLSVNQAMAAAHGTLVASAAAQIDNATAAKIVANALGAFNLRGSEAGRVANLLAGAANASTGEMTDYAAGLSQVGASAHQLHVPIQDTVTALAELSKAGVQGQDAGTSLKTALQRLVPTTAKAKQAMADLGISAFDSQGKFRGISAVSDQFRSALSKLTPEQRAQRLQTIFGTDAVRAANIVFGQGGAAFDKMRDKVTKSGQANKLAAAQSKGLEGAFQGLRSTVETLQLEIGLKLAPYVDTMIRQFTAALPGALAITMSIVGALATAIAGLVGFYGRHNTILTITLTVIAGLTAAFIAYQTVLKVQALYTRIAAAAQLALNTAMTLNPIGIVVVAIVALVAILAVLYTRNQTVRRVVDAAWSGIRNAVVTAVGAIRGAVTSAIAFVTHFWNTNQTMRSIVMGVWGAIRSYVGGQIAIMKDVALAIMALFQGRWGEAWHQISKVPGDLLRSLIGVIRGLGGAFVSAAEGIGGKIVDGILSGVDGLYQKLKDKLESEISDAMSSLNPFSPVEHGGALYIGQPIVAGALAGVSGLGPQMRSAIESSLASHLPRVGSGGVGVAGGGGIAVDGHPGGSGIYVAGDMNVSVADGSDLLPALQRITRKAKRGGA